MLKEKIFSDFIDLQIIIPLIDYLLIYNKKKCNSNNSNKNSYTIKRFDFYFNEILSYLFVSKKWFKTISNLISNNIISNNSIEYWIQQTDYDGVLITEYYNKIQYHPNNHNTEIVKSLDINKKHSIIKIDSTIIIDYFKSSVLVTEDLSDNQQPQQLQPWKSYRKVISNLYYDEDNGNEMIEKLIKLKSIGNNVQYNITNVNMEQLCQLEIPPQTSLTPQRQNSKEIKNVGNGGTDIDKDSTQLSINSIIMEGCDSYEFNFLKNVITMKPKHIKYSPNECYSQDSYNHVNYSQFFDGGNEMMESLRIDCSDHVEISHLTNLNKTPLLTTLSVAILFHDIIKVLNGENPNENGCDYHYSPLEEISTIQEDWQKFVNHLSAMDEQSSLKNLTIKNFCGSGIDCIRKKKRKRDESESSETYYPYSIISNGFLSIFENNQSIEYLKLVDLDFIIDIPMLSGLQLNKSIKTLVISGDDIPKESIQYLFTNVLNTNTSINHLKFIDNSSYSVNVFKLLKLSTSTNNLYSLSVSFEENQLEDFICFICNPTTTITEFNLYIDDNVDSIKYKINNHPKYLNIDLNLKKLINILEINNE